MKSLNPHCVSRMREVAGGVRSRSRRWKECIRVLRRAERWGWGMLVGGFDGKVKRGICGSGSRKYSIVKKRKHEMFSSRYATNFRPQWSDALRKRGK